MLQDVDGRGAWALVLLQGAAVGCPARRVWVCALWRLDGGAAVGCCCQMSMAVRRALWNLSAGAAAGCSCRVLLLDVNGCVCFGAWVLVLLQDTAHKYLSLLGVYPGTKSFCQLVI